MLTADTRRAIEQDMLTDEEVSRCQEGEYYVSGDLLVSAYVDRRTQIPHYSVRIFKDRKWHLLKDKLLGLT